MDKYQAIHNFWSSFGLPAYEQYSVPDDAMLPYITYAVSIDDFDHPVFLTASLWYHEDSGTWANVDAKEKQISDYIGRGGRNVSYDDGAFWITKGSPWAQRMNDPSDEFIRRILLQYNIEFLD